MPRVLVTGADGFTGRHVVPLLVQDGHEVIGLARAEPETPVPGLAATYACDLADSAAVARLIADIRPDRVLHLAGVAFVAHGAWDAFYAVNLLGSRALLDACAALGSAPLMVLAGSAQIYGAVEGMVSEDRPPNPANDYAVSKLAMEHVAGLYAARLPVTITRPFNYTGVGQSANFLIPKIVDHFRRRAPVIELGNIDVSRDFSDVRTVAEVYRRLLDRSPTDGAVQAVNICSGTANSLTDVLDLARDITGHPIDVQVNPAFMRANEVRTLVGDRTKLDRLVGPIDRPTLRQTLEWMIEAF
jgi:nucleoside-diphosphate-sugar epimerase